LVVGEVQASVADLFTKNAVLFGEVVDFELLMLVEPSGDASKK
jgi:hypothetical protein